MLSICSRRSDGVTVESELESLPASTLRDRRVQYHYRLAKPSLSSEYNPLPPTRIHASTPEGEPHRHQRLAHTAELLRDFPVRNTSLTNTRTFTEKLHQATLPFTNT